ncbi:MAG: acyl carrier protein [Candidatus Cloacimonas sp.]|nr:acyl carrier protein [Candidatus Cloacimonas sp.]
MDIIVKILQNIRPEFNFEDTVDFFKEGMLDSFDMLSLISDLEKEFDIKINGMDIIPENFNSLSSIKDLLKKYGVII